MSGLNKGMSKAQRTLLTVRNLTFKEAKDKCIAEELAAKATKEYVGLGEEVALENKVTSRPRPKVQQERDGHLAFKFSGRPNCKCCGSANHKSENCRFKQAVCHNCNKRGHIKYACTFGGSLAKPSLRKGRPTTSMHTLEENEGEIRSLSRPEVTKGEVTVEFEEDCETFGIYNTFDESEKPEPYFVRVNIANCNINMELDTGATFSTVNEFLYRKYLCKFPLRETKVTLRSYTDTVVPVLGSISVPVSYQGNPTYKLSVLVVKGHKQALLSRDWLRYIKLDWENIIESSNHVKVSEIKELQISEGKGELEELIKQNDVLFHNDNSGIRNFTANLKLKPEVKPIFQKSRPVPYSMTQSVEAAYDKLIKANIFYPMSNSRWASPVVHVKKNDGSVRVCGDYKAVNELIQDDVYKLPNISEMFAKITHKGLKPRVYSVLDLSGAFNQLFFG